MAQAVRSPVWAPGGQWVLTSDCEVRGDVRDTPPVVPGGGITSTRLGLVDTHVSCRPPTLMKTPLFEASRVAALRISIWVRAEVYSLASIVLIRAGAVRVTSAQPWRKLVTGH